MVKNVRDSKSYFDIRELILKGKETVREYNLPAGKVLIRPLTDLEIEECEAVLFDLIKDPATRRFVFETASEDLIDLEDPDSDENTKESTVKSFEEKLDGMENVNFSALMNATTQMMLKIVYMSMRDFTDPFDINDLKRLEGIKDLAHEIQRISGYSKNTEKEIEDFRTDT